MPNWVDNQLDITGNIEDVAKFLEDITILEANPNDTPDVLYDFTKVIPVPDVFKGMHSGARTIDGVKCKQWFEDEEGARPLLDMHALEITEEHGTCDPIEWQYMHWGTKWGDCDTELISDVTTGNKRELSFSFGSAWGEPWILLQKIAEKYNFVMKNAWSIEMNQGSDTTNYPIDNADKSINQFNEQRQAMLAGLNKIFDDKNE